MQAYHDVDVLRDSLVFTLFFLKDSFSLLTVTESADALDWEGEGKMTMIMLDGVEAVVVEAAVMTVVTI